MENKEEEVITYHSAGAAKFVENIKGWVDRNGRFYGNDKQSEHMARSAGSTHRECQRCGKVMLKRHLLVCDDCARIKNRARHAEMPTEEWDGKTVLFSMAENEFFSDIEALEYFCSDHNCTINDLLLVLCKPVFAAPICPGEYYSSDLPDDDTLPEAVIDAFMNLNKELEECKEPLSWFPGNTAAIIKKGKCQ